MSRASRLARRSKAEERHVEDYAGQRRAMIRAAGTRMPIADAITVEGRLSAVNQT